MVPGAARSARNRGRDVWIGKITTTDLHTRAFAQKYFAGLVHLGQGQAGLVLILACLVGVTGGTDALALEEDELCDALVGVDLGRQGGGVGDFEGDLALPLGLDGGHVDDDAAAGISGL